MPRSLLGISLLVLAAACAPETPPVTAPPPPPVPLASPVATAPPAETTTAPHGPVPGETQEQRATRLHRQAIIIDGHNDIPSVLLSNASDIATPGAKTHTDLARLQSSGITGEFFSIYVDGDLATKPTVLGGGALRRALDLIDVTYAQVERHPGELLLATSVADIRRAKREGKVAVLMGVEGGHAIENSLYSLRELYRLGCRYMTLTHTNTNEWADSSGFSGPPVVRHHGLAPFGEEVVREMQRIGMLVDVSHTSDETFHDVLEVAKAPIIASHSSARALGDNRRNLTDDMLKALARNGGIVMANFWTKFLSTEYSHDFDRWLEKNGKAFAAIRAKFKTNPTLARADMEKLRATSNLPTVPLSALIDHIDHMVKVAGIDHVGLGSDFDGVDSLPEGLGGVQDLPKITLELVKRGYSDEDILKILGGNFLRVFEAAEAYAKSTNTTLSGDGSQKRIDR